MVMVPERVPDAVGVKVKLRVQLPPGGRFTVGSQVPPFARAKSPLTTQGLRTRGAIPVLVIVMDCTELIVATV